MAAMMQRLIRAGQVWDAMVPYGEVEDAKRRPVVILGWMGFGDPRGDRHIAVVPSSTFGGDATKARSSDVRLGDWAVAGLDAGSFIQCARLWSLAPAAFDFDSGMKGALDPGDLRKVVAEVSMIFNPGDFAIV